jgi:hypothetical protein
MTYNKDIKIFLPGFFQGITRVFISYPFDFLRLNIQTNKESNIKQAIKNNYKNLYRGIYFSLITIPIDRGITFYLYEKIKKKYNPFIASFAPSLISAIYMNPISLINSNYIYYDKDKLIKTIKKINYNFYRGSSIEIFRNTMNSFLFLYSYNYYSKKFDNSLINGTLASMTMWTITYPLDTIKANKFIFNKSYLEIIKVDNINKLYKGISLVYLKSLPSAGIGMYVYEKVKKYLN